MESLPNDMDPKFTGVWIPREVLENEALTMTDKFVFAIIDGLDNEEGCWASNGYIAKIADVSDRQIKNIIKTLIDNGLVVRESKQNGQRVLRTITKIALLRAKGATDFPEGVKHISLEAGSAVHPYSIVDRKEDKITYLLPHGESFKKAWNEWVAFRKELRKPLKPTTIREQLVMLASVTESDSVSIIKNSILNGWQGLFVKNQRNTQVKKPLTPNDHRNGF